MLCSVSTRKSGSSWLDRLRTAKGFPENDATNLENFLQNPNSPSPERPDASLAPHSNFGPKENEDKQLFNVMSNVLNELFNFGDNCVVQAKFKKSARKQGNPRVCVFSNNSSDENNNTVSVKATALRSGDNNSGVEGVKELDDRETEREGDGDGKDGNLSGFSRTEVTVIDTSYECWKFDKLLYRRKNVWKVRDKKGKSESMGSKKKKKLSGGSEEDRGGGKKRKVGEAKGRGKQCEFLLNEDCHQSYKPQAPEKVQDKASYVPKKKQRDFKLDNGSSSVILIKSIPTSRKSGSSISKTCLKSQNKS